LREDYLAACASVLDRPNETRYRLVWTRAERARVEALIDEVPFLRRYRGTDVPTEGRAQATRRRA
jgi:hypothetical protein